MAKLAINPAKIVTKIMEVTPKLAAEWLEKDIDNRDLREAFIMSLARQMKAGEYVPTPEPIIFDEAGNLINGQHRLWAIVFSDTAVVLTVTWGWPNQIKTKIDHGQGRSTKDIFVIKHGERTGSLAISVTKHLLKYIILRQATDDEYLRFYKTYREGIDWLAYEGFARRTTRGITVAPVGAAIARAWFTSDRSRLKEFCDVLITGMPKNVGQADRAALILRRFLTEPKHKVPGKSLALSITMKTETAIQNFLVKKDLPKLYEAATELFPLPKEEIWRREFAKPLLKEMKPAAFPWRQGQHEDRK